MALGDLDGDGRLDIAVADGDGVSVLRATGDGSFADVVSFATAEPPDASLALGDLDGDGRLDIVTVHSADMGVNGTVSVLLAAGDGTFAAHVAYAAGSDPHAVALGDVNGDGTLDIVVANSGMVDGRCSAGVYLGQGDGTFADRVDYATGHDLESVALGDLNGDGCLDIVSVAYEGLASVLLGNGDGTFPNGVGYELNVGDGRTGVLGDMNGDGTLDLVTAGGSSHTGTVLLGQGDGTFPSAVNYSVDAIALALGDVNGDGKQDVFAVGSGDFVSVMLAACR